MDESQVNMAPAEDVAAFLKNWNPKGVVTADAAHIEGFTPLPTEVKEEIKVETPADKSTDVKAEEATQIETKTEAAPVESSLKSEEKIPTISVKSWEETLAERSGGKFKTYEELESLLNTPKKNEYKSTLAERIDAYVEQGGTEEDYLATQSTDFTKMTPTELIEYKIQMEDPEMSDEEIAYELKKRYGIDKWKDKADEYEDGVEPEEVRISKIRFNREALKIKSELIAKQKEWAIPEKKEVAKVEIDPTIQKRWNEEVEAAITKFDKVPLKISDNESYDFVVDESEKKELSKIASELFSTTKGFFDQFRNKDGSFNQESMAQAFFKMRNFDKAVAFVSAQAKAKGGESVVKEIKNTDFKPEGKSVTTKKPTTQDAIREQALKIARGEA